LIERNTTIPTRKSEVFSTAADSQTSVEVHVLQGERELARDNRTLGRFHLVGIPAAPRGMPQIEVTFDIDANGIVNVSAKDRGTGKEQKITISAATAIPDAEIQRMVKDAEVHASEDKARRETIEDHNRLDTLVYQTQKTFDEHKSKLGAAEQGRLESALATARKALEGEDHAAIKSALEELTKASHKIAEVMYQSAGPDTGAGAAGRGAAADDAPGRSAGDGDVIDAEYVDVDKKSN
jgi:molecular chaperone DnaK